LLRAGGAGKSFREEKGKKGKKNPSKKGGAARHVLAVCTWGTKGTQGEKAEKSPCHRTRLGRRERGCDVSREKEEEKNIYQRGECIPNYSGPDNRKGKNSREFLYRTGKKTPRRRKGALCPLGKASGFKWGGFVRKKETKSSDPPQEKTKKRPGRRRTLTENYLFKNARQWVSLAGFRKSGEGGLLAANKKKRRPAKREGGGYSRKGTTTAVGLKKRKCITSEEEWAATRPRVPPTRKR